MDTIQDMTLATGFDVVAAGPAPDTQTMITNIRKTLSDEVEHYNQALLAQNPGNGPQALLELARDLAKKNLERFDTMMREVPYGFQLVPVLYSKVGDISKANAYKEYATKVRWLFMKFLAENHAHELKALGIGPRGIQRMQKGRPPLDENGNHFNINVDHIIERGGGGKRTTKDGVDPLMPRGKRKTLLITILATLLCCLNRYMISKRIESASALSRNAKQLQ